MTDTPSLNGLVRHVPGWAAMAALASGTATWSIRVAKGQPHAFNYGLGVACIVVAVLVVLVAIARAIDG
jgi:hypothetical protein